MTFSAVLLAGGESRRMGQDKATTLFRNRQLWQHQLDTLRQISPQETFIAARTDPSWRPENIQFVADSEPSRGPLSGILATLLRATSAHLLVLAVDTPFVTAEYLRGLLGKVEPGCGVVPMIDNQAEPLAAIYPRNADVDLFAALNGHDFSLQAVVRRLIAVGKMRAIKVSPQDRSLFRNLNKPADLD
ncbi:MAG: hypothetical protein DME57_09720 [Verrucomicrobia bacterium]|nr:MAG: hypothetical protein DME57_09720 [Verrucomicrobiota bacterium]